MTQYIPCTKGINVNIIALAILLGNVQVMGIDESVRQISYDEFSNDVRTAITDAVKYLAQDDGAFIIQKETAESAIALMDYFIAQEKALCGYSTVADLEGITEFVLGSHREVQQNERINSEKHGLTDAMSTILMTLGADVSLHALVTRRKYPSATYSSAFNELEKAGLGNVSAKGYLIALC
ncbi:unnamed protein product [Didymodactylos carnosus]|uniref:Uncharacterized protein n=1 Tax=Didymodactylos carnosus TaxID=1234261 RepID=A0A8S2F1X7_9BILA|nr:unnamed protein product [Didymodactylos carnosus]CAF4181735.1 unnamed protein product [Didymodactylos carnosus]